MVDKVVGGEVEEGLVVGIMMEVFVKAKRMKSRRNSQLKERFIIKNKEKTTKKI